MTFIIPVVLVHVLIHPISFFSVYKYQNIIKCQCKLLGKGNREIIICINIIIKLLILSYY